MNGSVFTVLGPVEPTRLGITDAHTHLWIAPVPGADRDAPVLDDEATIVAGLRDYRTAGGGSMVDCQPGGCGRDGRVLVRLSQASGIHVVACTGFHRRRYYPSAAPPAPWHLDAGQAADYFLGELRHGLEETRAWATPVRAGFIKIAGEATLAETPRHLLEAAAAASIASGAAIEMHTERGRDVETFLRFFVNAGVAPEKVVFCHVDKRPDPAFHREIAASGAMLEYDTFFRPRYEPEKNVWPLLESMLDAGLGRQIALATDMADDAMWRTAAGGPGPAAFIETIKTRLEAWSLPDGLIADLLGGNIASRLAIHHTSEKIV